MLENSLAESLPHVSDDSRQGSELTPEKFRPNAAKEFVEHEMGTLVAELSCLVVCSVYAKVDDVYTDVVTYVLIGPENVMVDVSGKVDISNTSVIVRSVDIAKVVVVICAVYVAGVVDSVCFSEYVELVNGERVSDIVATSEPIGMVDCLAVDT